MNKTKSRRSNSPNSLDELDKVKTKSKKSKQKARDNSGQSSIKSFLQFKPEVHDEEHLSTHTVSKEVRKSRLIVSDESDDDFVKPTDKGKKLVHNAESEKKNAFTFMMDSRYKSIGQNSPGKEAEDVEEPNETKSEKKKKLLERKSLFQDWNERKGGKKRKVDDHERGIVIEKKLEDRSKRFKKMLKASDNKEKVKNKENSKKAKTKNDSQKENGDHQSNEKWKMKLRINLSDDDTNKFVISSVKKEETNKLAKVDLNKAKKKNGSNDALVNVAPVFNMQNSRPKPDPDTVRARKEFLHSDMPKAVKKHIDKHQRVDVPDYIVFPLVSHVTVAPNPEQLLLLNKSPANLELRKIDAELPEIGELTKGCLTESPETMPNDLPRFKKVKRFKRYLKVIKEENPDYPVRKTFKRLCSKCNRTSVTTTEAIAKSEQYQIWTDLYKPSASEEIFGNQSAVKEIKTWLKTWQECSKNINSGRNSRSEFESDDENSRDKLPGNSLMLFGPHSSGKTMTVYAICNELGINVLEVNASSKRTGKKLLSELQEATQSHQVRQNEKSLNAFLHKCDDHNKTLDQMCLLLIEDIDLVFEQDEGFLSALSQFLATSKRPIILTTTDKNCHYLQKFSSNCSTIYFKSLSTKLLSPWLQLVCLAEGHFVSRESIESLLENNNCDVRSTLLQLQFWCYTGDEVQNENSIEDLNGGNDSQSVINHKSLDLNLPWWNLESNSKTSTKDISNALEALITTDLIYKKFGINPKSDLTNKASITDGTELSESEESYSSCRDTCRSLGKTLIHGYLRLCNNKADTNSTDRLSPYNDGLKEVVPVVCHLQRDAVNLDYFSALRTINRTEMYRADNNRKRKNRFYNYLRGLGLNCSESNLASFSRVFNLKS